MKFNEKKLLLAMVGARRRSKKKMATTTTTTSWKKREKTRKTQTNCHNGIEEDAERERENVCADCLSSVLVGL